MRREAEIQKNIIDLLTIRGYMVFRMNAGRAAYNVRMAPAGTPDIMAIGRDGEVIWIEVKTPEGVISNIQKRMHKDLEQRGHRVAVVHSATECDQLLRAQK